MSNNSSSSFLLEAAISATLEAVVQTILDEIAAGDTPKPSAKTAPKVSSITEEPMKKFEVWKHEAGPLVSAAFYDDTQVEADNAVITGFRSDTVNDRMVVETIQAIGEHIGIDFNMAKLKLEFVTSILESGYFFQRQSLTT